MNDKISRMKNLMGINENNTPNIELFHAVLKNRFDTFDELLHSLFKNGLMLKDNGEVGNTIWLATNREYADTQREISFMIPFNSETKEKYAIRLDAPNAWAYKPIPFDDLFLMNLPVMENNGYFINNHSAIRFFKTITDDKLTKWLKYESDNFKIYNKIFEQMVTPFIENKNVINFFKSVDSKYIKTDFDQYNFSKIYHK